MSVMINTCPACKKNYLLEGFAVCAECQLDCKLKYGRNRMHQIETLLRKLADVSDIYEQTRIHNEIMTILAERAIKEDEAKGAVKREPDYEVNARMIIVIDDKEVFSYSAPRTYNAKDFETGADIEMSFISHFKEVANAVLSNIFNTNPCLGFDFMQKAYYGNGIAKIHKAHGHEMRVRFERVFKRV